MKGARKQPAAAATLAKPATTTTGSRRDPQPPATRKPVDLSKMTATERREYQQRQNKLRAARGDESADERKERPSISRKRTADGNHKPAAPAAARLKPSERDGKRRREDSNDESEDDAEEKQRGEAREGRPPSPLRTRGSRTEAITPKEQQQQISRRPSTGSHSRAARVEECRVHPHLQRSARW